jgi:hypothetical protein
MSSRQKGGKGKGKGKQREEPVVGRAPRLSTKKSTPDSDGPGTPPPAEVAEWEKTGFKQWRCVIPQLSVLLKSPLGSRLAHLI